MASLLHSVQATGKDTVMTPSGANDVSVTFGDYTILAANALNDIIEMCPLPANCVVTGVTLDVPSLDSSTGVVLAVGLMSGAWGDGGARTMTSDYVSGATVGRSSTGGLQALNVVGGTQVAATTADRSVGVKFTTAATGTAAVTGTIRLTVFFRPIINTF